MASAGVDGHEYVCTRLLDLSEATSDCPTARRQPEVANRNRSAPHPLLTPLTAVPASGNHLPVASAGALLYLKKKKGGGVATDLKKSASNP